MAVVVEICELVGPLGDYTQCVFEESNDDEEAANAREVSRTRLAKVSKWQRSHTLPGVQRAALYFWQYSRLDGVRDSVQPVLDPARLRSQLVQRTGVIVRVVVAPRVAKGALVAQMVASCAAYLRHGWLCSRE